MPFANSMLYPSPNLFPGLGGPFTDNLIASLSPWNDPAGHWQAYNAALATPFEQVASIVLDQGSPDDPTNFVAGWSILLDPDNCPAQFIPFGALFCGVVIPPGTDESLARAQWKAEAGFKRGSPGAIVAAAQAWLTGTQSVVLLERTPNAYSFQVVVRPEELIDLTGLTNAIAAAKPVGVTFTVVVTDSFIWNEAIHTWSADTMSWEATATQQP